MPAPPKCPGCGTKLQPDMESCPNCPMSFHDAPPEKTALQSDNFKNFGIPIIIFGGLAGVLWWYSTTMWKAVEAGVEDQPLKPPPTQQSSGDQSASAMIQAKVDELAAKQGGGEAPSAQAALEADEEEGQGAISIMPDSGRRAKVVTEWKMRGVIYDLMTLRPVPAARLIFTDNETNLRAVIQSDGNGRYRAILPPLPGRGYVVTISKPGYSNSYLNPGTEGVAEMSIDQRRELVKELSSVIAEPASLEPNSDTPLVTDFHLAPK